MKNSLTVLCFWVLSVAFGLSVVSCGDELSTSISDQPSLSADTLALGYLLAGNSSRTYQLHVVNNHDKEIRLSSVALRSGGSSGFRMNVDGMNGTVFNNADLLRIAAHDSMFIFVEATFGEDMIGPGEHTDYIDIKCNGLLRSVVLTAQSKEVAKLYGSTLMADETWQHGHEVQIYDSLVVAEGVTLVVEDSVTIYMHDKANIIVRGALQSHGRLGSPVTIRGDRMDKMFDNLPYDNLPSQWGRLEFAKTAKGSCLEYTDIHGMSTGIYVDSTDVAMRNCHLKNSDGNLLTGYMAELQLENCELSNAAGALFDAYGGWYDVNFCTLANYNFAAVIRQRAVHMCNILEGEQGRSFYTPLYRCNFTNTLVWGDTFNPDVYPEYFKVQIDEDAHGNPLYADSVFAYRFDHCLLRAKGENDDDFIETLWNQDPLFMLIDDPNYTYDFHLQENSPAIGAGVKTDVTCDLDGIERPDKPSIGCYEFVK